MTALVIVDPGPFSHIQDAGRIGYEHLGIARAGALDYASFALAQALAGNLPQDAAIEMTYRGLSFIASEPLAIATTGFTGVYINGREHPGWSLLLVPAGAKVQMGPMQRVRGYLAVRGGLDVPVVMGSRSTDFTAAIGGYCGRALRAADELEVLPAGSPGAPARSPQAVGQEPDYSPLRVILGPRSEYFSAAALRTLLTQPFALSSHSNIMGLRLTGPTVTTRPGLPGLLSEGTVPGSIQIPPDGHPIILLNQRGTTGGYPVAAVLVTPDLWRAAQWPLSQPLSFRALTLAGGQRAARHAFERLGII